MKTETLTQKLKEKIGEVQLRKLELYSFEFACQEAEYLRIEKQGHPFISLCHERKDSEMQYVYDEIILREYEDGRAGIHRLVFPDDNEITDTIKIMYEKR